MGTETTELSRRAAEILRRLERHYPEAEVELHFSTPLQLLVATILSAQSTDKRVNMVTPELFARYRDAAAFRDADQEQLEEEIRSTGFFRQKARNLRACCAQLVERHQGKVPADIDALTALAGVGRKTANVILAVAFGLPGIAVDTHCRRVSNRLGLSAATDPVKIEAELGEMVPPKRWADLSRLFIWHGRYTCKARTPDCGSCPVAELCHWLREQ